VLYISPCTLEIKCFCSPGKLNHTGHMILSVTGRDSTGNILEGRIRTCILTGDKGLLQASHIQAEIKLFDLFFSTDSDLDNMKAGSKNMWMDIIHDGSIKVSEYSSGRYIGRLEFSGKDKQRKSDLLFVFADGSGEPASTYFTWYSMLKSQD